MDAELFCQPTRIEPLPLRREVHVPIRLEVERGSVANNGVAKQRPRVEGVNTQLLKCRNHTGLIHVAARRFRSVALQRRPVR